MTVRHRRSALMVAAIVLVALQVLASPATAAVPVPGPTRALFGGPLNLQAREPALGRPLDVVRIYTAWETGPPAVNTTQYRALMDGGNRTLLISASIGWISWQTQAKQRNSDADPGNDVAEPYCGTRPVVPGTTQPSGRTWFGAVASGDYDASLRRWLEQLAALASETPQLYVSFHHEADRLGDSTQSAYQACVGTPAEYQAAWHRVRLLAEGTVGTAMPDLTYRNGGVLVLTPIFTTWGFWHTTTGRALIRPATGQPIPGGSPDDLTLWSSRVSQWVPAAEDYDVLGTDVFNYSGATAGSGKPTNVKVDDPATATKEPDQWRSLQVLVQPVLRWATNFAALPGGATRPLILAEYGSVPDPVRPTRRAAWLTDACRFLSAPDQARIIGALYFDVNQMRLTTWQWSKVGPGRWTAVGTPAGTDDAAVTALRGTGGSPRFGGTTAC